MDINDQLQPIVASIIDNLKGTIEAELRDQISDEVVKKIAAAEFESTVNALVQQQVQARLDNFNFVKASDDNLQQIVAQLTDQINKNLTQSVNQQISDFVNKKLIQIDFNSVIDSLIDAKVGNLLMHQHFPAGSIPHNTIDFSNFKLSGDVIDGGIIKNFGSAGIEDRATHVQLTLLDHASAFEGPLFAPAVTVKGDVAVDGRLILNGTVDESAQGFADLVNKTSDATRAKLNDELFNSFSNIIFNKIKTEGISLDAITQGGKDIVKGNQLGYHITDTNIRRLGIVNDLQTSGDNLLSETLFVAGNRVGVNTMDPTAVLSIWDQEVEITVSKRGQDTGSIDAPRNQRLILGSSGKDNIVLRPDGSTQATNLSIGNVPMTSSPIVPNYGGNRGQIVWNEGPASGAPIGWVCLGGTLWAGFGIIS